MVEDMRSAPFAGDGERPFGGELARYEVELSKALGHPPFTPDIGFVTFLRAASQFGFFRFGPITIDVEVVEDILVRTHPHGAGGDEPPMPDESGIRFSNWATSVIEGRGNPRMDERLMLLLYMQWPEGLPRRVFGELGVSVEEVEEYIQDLSTGKKEPRPMSKLYSTEQAAEYLGVHVQTVRTWIRSGRLPASRLAGQKSIRIREADLEAVLEAIEPAPKES